MQYAKINEKMIIIRPAFQRNSLYRQQAELHIIHPIVIASISFVLGVLPLLIVFNATLLLHVLVPKSVIRFLVAGLFACVFFPIVIAKIYSFVKNTVIGRDTCVPFKKHSACCQGRNKERQSCWKQKNYLGCCSKNHLTEDNERKRVVYGSLNYRMIETETSLEVSMDVPGIRQSEITVEILKENTVKVSAERRSDCTKDIKYIHYFVVKRRVVDTSDVKAELENGVLSIKFVKKHPSEEVSVSINESYPPENKANNPEYFLDRIEIPGVKPEDLKVKFYDRYIFVDGERSVGAKGTKVLKRLFVDEELYDTANMNSYLMNGVLTIVAPRRENSCEISKHPLEIRQIMVTVPVKNDDAAHASNLAISDTKEETTTLSVDEFPEPVTSNEDTLNVAVEKVAENDNEWISLSGATE